MKKRVRQALLIILDMVAVTLAFILAFFIRFEGQLFTSESAVRFLNVYMSNWMAITLIHIGVFASFKLYSSLWRYASVEELLQVFLGALISSISVICYFHFTQSMLPRSVYVVAFLLCLLFVGSIRFSYRGLRALRDMSWLRARSVGRRTLIYGAGDAGAQLVKELRSNIHAKSIPIGFIDDDVSKTGRLINGIPVLGSRNSVEEIISAKNIEQIIIAMPSADKRTIRDVIYLFSNTDIDIRITPSISELSDGKIHLNNIRKIEIDDLLGRDPVKLDIEALSHEIAGKRILVTGGGGSIGSEICRQVARFKPEALMVVDIYENGAYDLEQELLRKFPELNLTVRIASVRERGVIFSVMRSFRPDIVYHAAAHKHVPLMEAAPGEAIRNNVLGAWNTMQAARKAGARKFVQISTDKAVNPTNVMGATKRVCEMMARILNRRGGTEFVAVRFGNVLGSNGSVIPLFKKQIAAGGPVTVTHPDIIRYFMTIPEACRLVIQAGAIAEGGEIFILDMGEPVRIVDLARNLIRLSGLEPERDIPLRFTGLRPGEKLFEELLLDKDRAAATRIEKIYIEHSEPLRTKALIRDLVRLRSALRRSDGEALEVLKAMVPEYMSPEAHRSMSC